MNRWENEQAKPSNVSWQRILDVEDKLYKDSQQNMMMRDRVESFEGPGLDFSANPNIVSGSVRGHRLAYGHLFNRAFASEISLVDPLPHQRIAVYSHMLKQSL